MESSVAGGGKPLLTEANSIKASEEHIAADNAAAKVQHDDSVAVKKAATTKDVISNGKPVSNEPISASDAIVDSVDNSKSSSDVTTTAPLTISPSVETRTDTTASIQSSTTSSSTTHSSLAPPSHNTTTSAPTTTTTTTTTSTTTAPPIPPPTTPSTNTTTVAPTTTSTTPSPPPTPKPPVPPCNRFNASSFVGGIVLTLGLLSIGLVAYKFFKGRTDRNYQTL